MNPEVHIIATGEAARSFADAAVVIDVLRAFTVTPLLYARGAQTVWLANDDATALATTERLRAVHRRVIALKDGRPAPGFRDASPRRVHLVVTGASGAADEDVACAELIRARLLGHPVDQDALGERVRASEAARDLAAGLDAGFRGVHADDVHLACEVDSIEIALVRQHERDLVHLRPIAVPGAGRARGRRAATTSTTSG